MNLTISAILFTVFVLLVAHASAAQEEEHTTLRGLKAPKPPPPPPYTVQLNQDLVNPGVIYGSGNANGNFVIGTSAPNSAGKKVRIGLRAKEAFVGNTPPNPSKPYEYVYNTGFKPDRPGRPRWNFDYEFDSDVESPAASTSSTPLATYVYEVAMDLDPTINTNNWIKYDPINQPYVDHSFGKTDTTPANDLVVAANNVAAYAATIQGGEYHVAQNSFNYAFLGPAVFPPSQIDTEGIYDVVLSIKNKTSGKVLVKATIRVLVKDDAKCAIRGKCFPTFKGDCTKSNILKFNAFFTSKQTKECEAFVLGITQ